MSQTSATTLTFAGSSAFFTIDRPHAGNAMTWEMYEALVTACSEVDAARDRVRTFVIRANGGVFCTGTDISQFTTFGSGADGLEYERRLEVALSRLEAVSVPTIAQVDGIAAGAGCAIALACDLRVCTRDARFGVPIARTLGNGLSLANCARLVEYFGMARTKDLLLTGRLLDADEAVASGVVTLVTEANDLSATVDGLCTRLAANAPLTLVAMKTTLRHLSAERRAGIEGLEALLSTCYASQDFREGVSAFLAKRRPTFTGH